MPGIIECCVGYLHPIRNYSAYELYYYPCLGTSAMSHPVKIDIKEVLAVARLGHSVKYESPK